MVNNIKPVSPALSREAEAFCEGTIAGYPLKNKTVTIAIRKAFSIMKFLPTLLTALVVVAVYALIQQLYLTPRLAFINTGKLLVGFSEAAKIEREVKAEDDKWRAKYKSIADSVQAGIDKMSKEFEAASPTKKREMQDLLAARNQQLNNFQQANVRKIEEMRQKKLQTVFDKANVFLAEYGKKHRYTIIFGTVAGGSILYGNESACDITDQVIKGLNERYK